MTLTRRTVGVLLIGTGACFLAGPAVVRLLAFSLTPPGITPSSSRGERVEGQEQAPNRREFTLTARDYRFSPSRIEVTQDDLVKVTVQSEDNAYSLTIDEYRVSKRIPAGGVTAFEFRADRTGTFSFYSNLTSDARHAKMRGELIVRAR